MEAATQEGEKLRKQQTAELSLQEMPRLVSSPLILGARGDPTMNLPIPDSPVAGAQLCPSPAV